MQLSNLQIRMPRTAFLVFIIFDVAISSFLVKAAVSIVPLCRFDQGYAEISPGTDNTTIQHFTDLV